MSICITLHLIFIHYTLLVVEFCILFIYDVIKRALARKKMSLSFGKAKKVNGEE